MLCHFLSTYCKYIALLYYLLQLDYMYDKFVCVEHSMGIRMFRLQVFFSNYKTFHGSYYITYVPAHNYMYACMYVRM